MITLGDKIEISNGYAFKSSKYVSEGVRVIRITNVQKGRIADEDPRFYPNETINDYSRYLIKPGDILMSLTGNVGRVGVFPKELCPAFLNQRVARLRVKSNDLDQKYLYYLLNSEKFEKQAIFNSSGIAQMNLSTKWVSNYEIPLPPINQQKQIAKILDTADGYRQKTKALIEKYDALTQSLFLEMFGDPVMNPKGWGRITLNELCDFKKISVKPEEIDAGDTYIGLECIEKETGKILERFTVEAGEIKSNKFWFDSNYILYGKLRPYLNKVANPDFEGVCSTDIIPLRPILKKTSKEFIISLLRGSWFVSFANERCSGANLPRISPKEVERYQTINPPLELQNQFAERVQAIEAQKTLAQKELEKAEELFQSLLQRAFKGDLN